MHKTAVLLVNYNSASHTADCVESLAKGEGRPLVVVVDNASLPEDLEKLKELEGVNALIRSEENLGFGRGNNLGLQWLLQNTECQYIFVLNNDTTVEPQTISILESFMDANADVGATSPRIMFAEDPDLYWYGGGSLNWSRGGARSWKFLEPYDQNTTVSEVGFMTGCAMFLRRDLVASVKGFDPRFFMYCEDWEFSSRIARSQWKMCYIPTAVIYHEGHASVRGSGENYQSPLAQGGDASQFYVRNVVAGSLLALHLSAPLLQRFAGTLYFLLRWLRWSVGFAWRRQWSGFGALGQGISLFMRMRRSDKRPGWRRQSVVPEILRESK